MINQFENTHIIIFLGIEVGFPELCPLPCSASCSGRVLACCCKPKLHELAQIQSCTWGADKHPT